MSRAARALFLDSMHDRFQQILAVKRAEIGRPLPRTLLGVRVSRWGDLLINRNQKKVIRSCARQKKFKFSTTTRECSHDTFTPSQDTKCFRKNCWCSVNEFSKTLSS